MGISYSSVNAERCRELSGKASVPANLRSKKANLRNEKLKRKRFEKNVNVVLKDIYRSSKAGCTLTYRLFRKTDTSIISEIENRGFDVCITYNNNGDKVYEISWKNIDVGY